MLWCLCALRGRARRRQWCDSLDYVTVYGAGACLYSPLTLTVSTDLGSRTTDSTALPMLWTPSNHNRNHFQFHKGKPEVVTVMSLQPVESGKRLCSLRSDAEAGIGLAEPENLLHLAMSSGNPLHSHKIQATTSQPSPCPFHDLQWLKLSPRVWELLL